MEAAMPPENVGVLRVPFDNLRSATNGFRDSIGHGATGSVFKGTLVGTAVAVKVLNLPAGSSATETAALRKRFLSELRTLDRLQHVRLVRLHAYAVDEAPGTEHPFALVFELLEGGSLADWLVGPNGEEPARTGAAAVAGAGAAAGPAHCALTALQRIDIALGVAAGLSYLHNKEEEPEAGGAAAGAGAGAGAAVAAPRQVVLHRDIKAANIGLALLAGGEMHARLLDFGLARALLGDGAAPAGAAHTTTAAGGLPAGTRHYMAPELLKRPPTVQSEIYAFGVVLLELLMGRRLQTEALESLLDETEELGVEEGSDLIASKADAGVWAPAAAAELAAVVVHCTRHLARRRPADVAEVSKRLRAVRRTLEPAVELVECFGCYDVFPAADTLTCAASTGVGTGAGAGAAAITPDIEAHHMCRACVKQQITAIGPVEIDLCAGRVPCRFPECTTHRAPHEMGEHLDKAALLALYGKLESLAAAARSKRAFEASMQDKLERGLRGPSSVPERAALLADVVRERDLTLHCPRCALSYVDVVGCNAATCASADGAGAGAGVGAGAGIAASAGCGALFCAVCNREFPDATACHDHVAEVHAGGVLQYYNDAQRREAQKERRVAACIEAVRCFGGGAGGAELQRAVADALGDAVLADVGLTATSLVERAASTTADCIAMVVVKQLQQALDGRAASGVQAGAKLLKEILAKKGGADTVMIAAGALPVLLQALQLYSDNDRIRKVVVNAVGIFSMGGAHVRQALLRGGVVPALSAVLQGHGGDKVTAMYCVGTLANCQCAPVDKCEEQLRATAPSILAALRLHVGSRSVAFPAVGVINDLCRNADAAREMETRESLAREGAVAALTAALQAHPDDARICKLGCTALLRLAAAPGNEPILLRDVPQALVEDLAGRHPKGSAARKPAAQLIRWLKKKAE